MRIVVRGSREWEDENTMRTWLARLRARDSSLVSLRGIQVTIVPSSRHDATVISCN